jgi:hypothetical protein
VLIGAPASPLRKVDAAFYLFAFMQAPRESRFNLRCQRESIFVAGPIGKNPAAWNEAGENQSAGR